MTIQSTTFLFSYPGTGQRSPKPANNQQISGLSPQEPSFTGCLPPRNSGNKGIRIFQWFVSVVCLVNTPFHVNEAKEWLSQYFQGPASVPVPTLEDHKAQKACGDLLNAGMQLANGSEIQNIFPQSHLAANQKTSGFLSEGERRGDMTITRSDTPERPGFIGKFSPTTGVATLTMSNGEAADGEKGKLCQLSGKKGH